MTNSSKPETIRPRRSFIFTPGLKPEMFTKALASGADMVCIELEDGVAPKAKDEARRKGLSLFFSEYRSKSSFATEFTATRAFLISDFQRLEPSDDVFGVFC